MSPMSGYGQNNIQHHFPFWGRSRYRPKAAAQTKPTPNPKAVQTEPTPPPKAAGYNMQNRHSMMRSYGMLFIYIVIAYCRL